MITISAVILAGGLARRMNGADKGLQLLGNQPLIQYVIERLAPQIKNLSINANRHQTEYKKFGLPVFADKLDDFQGPLSGILTALQQADTDYILFVPCDCPFLPDNLVQKLKSAVQNSSVLSAYVTDGEREHPTFCLISRQLVNPLQQYLDQGERRMLQFFQQQNAVKVDFSEQKSAFRNFNTLEELQQPIKRCDWCGESNIYVNYHDHEWGKPQFDSLKLFEQLCLEGQQAGLSWITVLKKRDAYRKAFFQFDPNKIANMTESDIDQLMLNVNLIRHRAKLKSIVFNAQAYLSMQKSGQNFSDFIWSFVNQQPQINYIDHLDNIPTKSIVAKNMSKALKKLGFTFVGEATCYAFMQAMGLVNDHLNDCCYKYK